MKLALNIWGLCGLFFIEVLGAADNSKCQFWNQLADKLSHADEKSGGALRFACNSSCSNITCNGHFKPSVFTATFEMDLCFGLRLNPCENPVAMDYYVDVPNEDASKAINMSGSIAHNSSFDIPGPTLAGIKTTIVVLVEMVRVNSTHVVYGINADVRATMGGLPTFSENRKVLPPMYIDVPPCTDDMKNLAPMKSPAVCTPLPTTATTPHTPKATKGMSTPKPVTVVNSKTYNQSCELGVGNCEKYEMCIATTDKNKLVRSGVCQCQPDTMFDGNTGFCKPASQTTQKTGSTAKPTNVPSVTIAQNSTDKGKKGGINIVIMDFGRHYCGEGKKRAKTAHGQSRVHEKVSHLCPFGRSHCAYGLEWTYSVWGEDSYSKRQRNKY
ncbi:uncharacterized protein LOC123526546 isoform X2 [Mercenaria mercenaria]|uniref:uncharacterized protein LOC123526546 isoform X2 n=1 Tax=Mercenaria mercenaria TaxID=6596 RepID=UPI00234F8756|nr:uncharacterized protein LOC123526546 isoform X2 [Mercenaria mercenaria]